MTTFGLLLGALSPATAAAATIRGGEELTLATALAKATRNNPALYARRLNQELNEIEYDNAWARMWVPSVGLSLTANAPYSVGQLPGSPAKAQGKGALEHGNPGGGAMGATSLNIGQYTLYNFGKDRDTYEISRLEVERSRQNVHEIERQVRFDTIAAVFNLRTSQDILDAAQRSVDSARAIHELVRSRASLGRVSHAELASVEIDLLTAKNALVGAQTAYNQALWNLNVVLGDPLDHPYNVRAAIKYIKFKMPLEDCVRVFKENAPGVRDARKNLEQARLAMKIAEKNALPLPAITFSGVQIGTQFTGTGASGLRNTTPGNGNLDVSASVNFTLPLVGDGGFLNGRALRAAELREELAELELRNAANFGETDVRVLYTKVLQTENVIENNERMLKDALRVFETTLSGVQTKATMSRLDIKDAIRQLRDAEIGFTQSVLDHYRLKLSLAQAIGVDRFPEENL